MPGAGTIARLSLPVPVAAGSNTLKVDEGGGYLTATVTPAEYFWRANATSGDLCHAAAAALSAATGVTYAVSLLSTGQLKIERQPHAAFSINWGTGTLSSALLGFVGGVDLAAGGVLTSDHQVGRAFFAEQEYLKDTEETPSSLTTVRPTAGGRVRTSSWRLLQLRTVLFAQLPGRKIRTAEEVRTNEAFQRLWEEMTRRPRFEFTRDWLTNPTPDGLYVVTDEKWLREFPARLVPQMARRYDLEIPMQRCVG
jgi:hypothetical protein